MTRVTVQTIADELGLSKFAVSRALTGKPGVSEATREKVVQAAERFGYVPRPKFKRQANGIEIIYHDAGVANRELWVEIQAGAQAEALRLGLGTAVRWTSDSDIIERLKSATAGFILVGPHEMSMIEAARHSRVPCVRIGPPLPVLDSIDQIGTTDSESGIYVANYLGQLGHRRLVFAHGRVGLPGRAERLSGFRRTLARVDGSEVRELTFPEDNAPVGFREAVLEMARGGFEPTAFFCGNDNVAVTVMSELMRMGLRVPEDVSVVGFGDYASAMHISPHLTTVKVPFREMGAAGVRMLLSRAGRYGPDNDLPPSRLLLVPKFLERQSTAAPTLSSWLPRLRLDGAA